MWILFARAPRPDAVYWSGRRWLAALDATLWPALALWGLLSIPGTPGLAKPLLGIVALLAAFSRLARAVGSNHRYWFTTWWVLRAVAVLLMVGLALKFALH
jgi:hypothetical protein